MSQEVCHTVFHIRNDNELHIEAHPIKVGIPLPPGKYHPNSPPLLMKSSGEIVSTVSLTASSFWPDNSYRWVMAEGTIALPANTNTDFFVGSRPPPETITQRKAHVSETFDELTVKTSCSIVTFSKTCFARFSVDNLLKSQGIRLNLTNSDTITAEPTTIAHDTRYCLDAPIVTTISQAGRFIVNQETVAKVELESSILIATGEIQHRITLTNPKPALHPNGQWDLGDPNSLNFSGCYWVYECDNETSNVTLHETMANKYLSGNFSLHQESSGNSNWKSPVHVDKNNSLPLQFRGFRCIQNHDVVFEGNQAEPHIEITNSNHVFCLHLPAFWQNFPADVQHANGNIAISILGSSFSQATELQPGEQKTRFITLNGNTTDKLQKPELIFNTHWVHSTGAIPFLPKPENSDTFQQLIQHGVEGASSFFEKREMIDEYGWRHFGELYADHEIPTEFDGTFVSHYNNQYDPIFGMLCQWLVTGNQKWFTLADDLAKHVADIDVYHTSDDKPEYAGGLFWHTDHYVQAYTATHRTYSRLQPTDVYEDHAGGGGPGGQHCYTNGLLLHYLITGYRPAKEALLTICDWITRVYEGDNTLTGFLLSLKNRNRIDLKHIISGKYPLDRGTANYIHARLDRYILTQHGRDLSQAEHIIFNTLSPNDDIAQRDLKDVENTWFYTVLLQALCRYIIVKQGIKQDTMLKYAIDALVHYATWMIKNEDLSLHNPEILEFPNETWSAQDLRKLCVLSFAKPFMKEEAQAESKITAMAAGIAERLKNSEESSTTRLLCLMMQNANYRAYEHSARHITANLDIVLTDKPDSAVTFRLADTAIRTFRQFNLRRELTQFKRRFPAKRKTNGLV